MPIKRRLAIKSRAFRHSFQHLPPVGTVYGLVADGAPGGRKFKIRTGDSSTIRQANRLPLATCVI
jgi:hypothetical protein